LFLIALRMIFPGPKGIMVEEVDGEPFIVPLAIPLIAGPGAMATLMLLMARDPVDWPRWLGALLLAWSASSVILLLANQLARLLGKRTITAIERLWDCCSRPWPFRCSSTALSRSLSHGRAEPLTRPDSPPQP
jgi:small neutral amino acid transporter SnatA (MarC family)